MDKAKYIDVANACVRDWPGGTHIIIIVLSKRLAAGGARRLLRIF